MADTPNSRIVPKNLLVSASRATSDKAVREGTVHESNVRDLCTLIDLAVLYDEVETLGSQYELNGDYKPHIALEYDSLKANTGLTIKVGPDDDQTHEETFRQSVAAAAQVFTLEKRVADPEQLRSVLGAALRIQVSDQPDYWEDFDEGRKLLLAKTLDKQLSESEKFWLRTFLYSGLAAARKLPWVPDAIRAWGNASSYKGKPDDYSSQLQRAIRSKYPDDSLQNLILDAPFPIPPFAAAVFLNTKGDRKRIWDEVKKLREDLSNVRKTLSSLQLERKTGDYSGLITIFGQRHTAASKDRLDDQVQEAIETLRKLKIPLPPQLLILKPVYQIAKDAASLITDPIEGCTKAFEAVNKLREVVTTGQELESWSDRYAFAEVHYQLGWSLRSWLNEGVRLSDLFGTIKNDEPVRETDDED